ncbi:BAR domain-containing protein [Wolbachia endosymbiont of Chironomus riparius]|uniref:hypothetical protein n=1 Tax=Wolbachia endosymbiont of Chironomus riparius TaxID=2883238 RepID=UPI00209F0BF9|nr:hypothetical protein [Wolbachia endosymbiont of Chironomus riparius]
MIEISAQQPAAPVPPSPLDYFQSQQPSTDQEELEDFQRRFTRRRFFDEEPSQNNALQSSSEIESEVAKNSQVGESETFEFSAVGEGYGAELEGGVESIEAAETAVTEESEVGAEIIETSAELGAEVSIEVAEDSIPIAGWVAGALTLVLIVGLGYKLAKYMKETKHLSKEKTKAINDMIKKINEIEQNIQNKIHKQEQKEEKMIQKHPMLEMINEKDDLAKELDLFSRDKVSFSKIMQLVPNKIHELLVEKKYLHEFTGELIKFKIGLKKIIDKENNLDHNNKEIEREITEANKITDEIDFHIQKCTKYEKTLTENIRDYMIITLKIQKDLVRDFIKKVSDVIKGSDLEEYISEETLKDLPIVELYNMGNAKSDMYKQARSAGIENKEMEQFSVNIKEISDHDVLFGTDHQII